MRPRAALAVPAAVGAGALAAAVLASWVTRQARREEQRDALWACLEDSTEEEMS